MTQEIKSEGKCRFCKKTISGRAMERHLKSCKERIKANEPDMGGKVFLIKASCNPFFVYFEANASSALEEIDRFLRKLWLECCGHLSAFTINKQSYSSHEEQDYGEKTMNIKLKNILKPGLSFGYEYDFGTTTGLDMKCISERRGDVKGIKIIARNDMPKLKCEKCGKPAKEVCAQCIWEGEGLVCESCAKTHKCGEEALLPLVNSPRSGMCGFTGDECSLLNE